MIPKIIHYTWFSGEEYPTQIKECIDSWHKYMPEYDYCLWDYDRVRDIDFPFLREALQMKKWAFAADLVRLYAVYNYGGIYLDTDVEVLKSFDSLLDNKAFIGREGSICLPNLRRRGFSRYLTSHCFGAEKGHLFIKDCMDYYADRHFILSSNERQPEYFRMNMVLAPYIQYEIALQYGYDSHPFHETIQKLKEGLMIMPYRYFDPANNDKDSFCRHLALGEWVSEQLKQSKKVKRNQLLNLLVKITRNYLKRKNYLLIKID